MKVYLMFFLSAIFPLHLFAQDAHSKQDIISFRDLKVSVGGNLEAGILFNHKKPSPLVFLKKDERKHRSGVPYRAVGFAVDLHSAHSLIGLMTGFDQSRSKFGLYNNTTGFRDFFEISKIEIPVYLQFRTGSGRSVDHFWGIIGAIYNTVQKTIRQEYSGNFAMNTTLLDKDKNQADQYFAVSAGLGYDLFLDRKTRHFPLAFFSRFSVPVGSELNSAYAWSRPGGKSVLVGTNSDVRNTRLSAGIKLMYQF